MLLCNRNSELLKLGDIGYFVRGLTYANEDVTENKAATAVIRANNKLNQSKLYLYRHICFSVCL